MHFLPRTVSRTAVLFFIVTISLFGQLSTAKGLSASKGIPPIGMHMNPCPRFSRISKQPYNPIGHVISHFKILDSGIQNCTKTKFTLDKFTDSDTFDPSLRFTAIITSTEDKMNMNFAIIPISDQATIKHFYFRVIFQEKKNSPIRADFSYFLDGFNSCDVDAKLLLRFNPIVEVFEYRTIHNA